MRNTAVPAAAFILLLASALPASAEDQAISLAESIRSAAEKNLDVAAELYNTAIAEAEIRKSYGIYDPRLNAFSSYEKRRVPGLSSGSSFDAGIGISKPLPSGATVDLGFNNTWSKDGLLVRSNPITRSDSWESDLSLSVSQPLLRNFGRENTEIAINTAKVAREASAEQFLSRLQGVVSQVRTGYFRLYRLQEDLEVKRKSLALANRILDETRARVKAGVLPAMEITNAEFGVSAREKDLIDAERAVRDEEDSFRNLARLDTAAALHPTDQPVAERIEPSDAEAVEKALRRRPEIRRLKANLQVAELQVKAARNLTLPDLSVTAGAGLIGVSESYSSGFGDMASGRDPAWKVGVSFSYPLGNVAAKNELVQSRLRLEQLRTLIRAEEEGVRNEVQAATRGVRSAYKQLEVARRGAEYAEQRLDAFMKKNAVGLATTRDVLDVENDLADARSAQIAARAAYDAAVTAYWKSTGDILDVQGITVDGKKADALLN